MDRRAAGFVVLRPMSGGISTQVSFVYLARGLHYTHYTRAVPEGTEVIEWRRVPLSETHAMCCTGN